MNWHIIVEAISIFKEKYPYVTIELTEGTTNEVKEMVIHKEVDFGISIPPFDDFDYKIIIDDRMVVNTKEELTTSKIDFSDIKEPLLICRAGYESVYPALEQQMTKVPAFTIIQGASTVRHMASQNLGIGIISYLGLGEHRKDFPIYPVEPEIKMYYAVIGHNLKDLTPVANTFISILDTIKEEVFYKHQKETIKL